MPAIAFDFRRLWQGLEGQAMDSLASAWALLAKDMNGGERSAGEAALAWNTVLAPRRELAVALPSAAEVFNAR